VTRAIRLAAVGVAAGLLALLAPGLAATARAEDSGRVAEVLRERLDQLQAAGRIEARGAELLSRHALPVLYQQNGYRPYWTADRLDVLLELIRESEEDGLRPEDYHQAALVKLAPALKAPGVDAATRAQGDLLATDAFVLLLYHLYLGKVDPKALDPQWNFELRQIRDQAALPFVRDALTQGRLKEAVARVRPDLWWYERARAALARYRAIAARGGWAPVPAGKKLQPGGKDARVPALRRRLAATGELPGQPLDSEAFDQPLAAAVKEFQARHRLEPDGAVGPGTLAELNVSVESRILQIRINLERARWVLHEITPGDLVIVDVAGFEVAFVRNQKVLWRAKVQIGKPYRQTPIFKAMIDNVVFNPTWTVPPGIIEKDVLPAVKRDPGYLEKKKLNVIDRSGKKVDPSSINWSKQSADTFPYMLRQEPGPDNALGRVKINFPNPYLVYLHDTPSKALFEKEERAFSSGCIRVERPLELAALLLNDPQKWNAGSIEKVIEVGETQTVPLPRPVPVLLMYWTIDPGTEGQVEFKRDPYGRDPRLAQALDARFSPGQRPAL
jgi:murein L,D-transpeptidase YcbB/YkuD